MWTEKEMCVIPPIHISERKCALKKLSRKMWVIVRAMIRKKNDRNQDQRADEVWELDKVKFENFRTTWIF